MSAITARCVSASKVTLLFHVIEAQTHILGARQLLENKYIHGCLERREPLLANPSHYRWQFSLIRNNCAGPKSNKGRSRAGFVLCVIRRVGVSLGMNGDIFTTWLRSGIRTLCRHSENKPLFRANKTNTWIFTIDFYWLFQKVGRS